MKELRWVKPKVVVDIEFVEWTRHHHLRHATFPGIRTHKKPEDVIRDDDQRGTAIGGIAP